MDSFRRDMVSEDLSAEVGKLKSRIIEIDQQRHKLAAKLGEVLYEATKDKPEFRAGHEDLFDEMAALDGKRELARERIAELARAQQAGLESGQTYLCPSCGAELSGKPFFCSTCGAAIDPEQLEAAKPEATLACPLCGGRVHEHDVFCLTCGTNLKEYAASVSEADEDGSGQEEVPVEAVDEFAPETPVIEVTEEPVPDAPAAEEVNEFAPEAPVVEPAPAPESAPVVGDTPPAQPDMVYVIGGGQEPAAPQPEAAPQPGFIQCPGCGKSVSSEYRFCIYCGATLPPR